MTINVVIPEAETLKPRLLIFGVGGGGCNAVNNMIREKMEGVDFVLANTDAQALEQSLGGRKIQLGAKLTRGQGAGNNTETGEQAAEESLEEINDVLQNYDMVFVATGMGGGTGTGAAPVIARQAREMNCLTVGVITTPFEFEGQNRMNVALKGVKEMEKYVDTLLTIPNQNLFKLAKGETSFTQAFALADDVLHSTVSGITNLMACPGLINLDFADVRAVMRNMGRAIIGTGIGDGDNRAVDAAEKAISNPLLADTDINGARAVLVSVAGPENVSLFDVEGAVNRIRSEVHEDASIKPGVYRDESLGDNIRVLVIATGINMSDEEAQHVPGTLMPVPHPDGEAADAAEGTRVAMQEDNVVPLHDVARNPVDPAAEQNGLIQPLANGADAAQPDEASGIGANLKTMFGSLRNRFTRTAPPPVPQSMPIPQRNMASDGFLTMPSVPRGGEPQHQEELPLPSFLRKKV